MVDPINYWTAAGVFFGYLLFDSIYVLYMKAVMKKRAFYASLSAGSMYVVQAFAIVSFAKDWRYSICVVLGAMCGTYIAVKFIKQ